MSVEYGDIMFKGSAVMPEDDTTTQIGGAIVESVKISFKDLATTDTVKAVSENAGDTTQTITVTGRDATGAKFSEGIDLNGQTPVESSADFERLLKAVKSATCAGVVAVMSSTNQHNGTAQGGGANYINLAAGASGTDDFYLGQVIRITGGTGIHQLREIVKYNGTLKRAYVRTWTTNPDATSTYEIADGVVFEKTPDEILTVRRVFYDAAANAEGGADKVVHEKIFAKNNHATLALTNGKIAEVAEGIYAKVDFDLESTLDGSDDNGSGNTRLVAPGGYTFDSAEKDIANSGNLSPDSAQGLWLALDLNAGDPASKSFWKPQVSGTSI